MLLIWSFSASWLELKGKAYQMILPNQLIKNISWWCTKYGVIEISNFFYSHYLSFVKVSVIENCRCQSLDILIWLLKVHSCNAIELSILISRSLKRISEYFYSILRVDMTWGSSLGIRYYCSPSQNILSDIFKIF